MICIFLKCVSFLCMFLKCICFFMHIFEMCLFFCLCIIQQDFLFYHMEQLNDLQLALMT